MAVRITQPVRVYVTQTSQLHHFMAGDVVDGDLGQFVQATQPDTVWELVEAPQEPEPAPSAPPDPNAAPVVPSPTEEPVKPVDPVPTSLVTDFEPADHLGPEVIAYAKDHPDEVAAIEAKERAGKARTTVLNALAD